MSSTFIEHSPETDGDKSLILIMDGEGNITADRAHFEKIVSNQKIPDLGIKIVRLDSNHIGSDNNSESKQELKLTVEEIYAESLPLGLGDQTVMSSPLEILPGPSTENLGHDIVDPFSQMDPEQLQRLEHALASEQAKQILGENVAAMFDMLSVDDSPAAFLRNSIKNDHCYTNLLPSSDPNGPSFFMNDNRSETSRKGKAKVGTPVKGKKTLTNGPSGNDVKKGAKEWQNVKQKQSTMLDYGVPMKVEEKQEEEDVDVEESEASVGEEEEEEDDEGDDDNLSDEDYSNRSSGRGKRKKRHRKKVVVKKSGLAKTVGRGWVGKPGRFGRRSTITPEVRARNEKLNETMSKIVQSMGVDKGDDKSDLKKGMKKMKTLRTKSKDEPPENEKAKEIQKTTEEVLSPAKSQPTKYPKRENRKPPAHLADAFGPALFSTPDIIRRVTTANDDVPQTPPEKKNFTVGAKLSDRGITKPGKSEPQNTKPKEPVKVSKSKEDSSQPVVESLDQKTSTPKSETSNPEVKKTYLELKKLIEKQQVKASDYEDHDYSDENIDEIYLDPTQMDQSLLEGFSQTVSKSEDQLLQEAILLQEQLIESNKGILIPESEVENLEDTQGRLGFGTETIEDIQNEITSSILVVQEQPKQDNFQLMPGSNELSAKSAVGETESESLTGDDSKEERRRNSAKRRRSDEVSDLDSDLDDALSEASWNSEDDPDRLWCICRKPHNNRFMICCDVCEEWFHGKCVGITKTIGKQMEQDGLEWSCPNCTKKKKAEEYEKEAEKIRVLKEKMAQSIKDQQQKIKESQKLKNQGPGGKEKLTPKLAKVTMKQTKISDFSHGSGNGLEEEETVGRKCIMCKGPVRENSIYCSDDCIRKHSQHAISQLMADSNKKGTESSAQGMENSKAIQKIRKEDPRIVVMDSNSKKFLVGQNAPTAANLTTWLKENPSYHVVYKKTDKPGRILLTSRKVVKIQEKPKEPQKVLVQAQKPEAAKSTQLKLAVSPNSKQINILQPGAKKVYQLVNTSGTGAKQTAYVVKPKQTEIIEALPFPVKTVFAKGVQLKVKEAKEATSPKSATQAQTPTSKESPVDKQEKVPKKRKERTQKLVDAKMGTSVKPEEGKEKEKKDTDQAIRESVKKTLADTLKARVQENKNMEFNEKHIEELAVRIEEKLYKHFENKVDTKYKSKYRSLVFNIKDPKNETLYKKIVDNSISPKELVKLSPEELASQELARWREKENQHQLEMIKMTELELMTKGNTYIMKSHKGEQVIESDQKVAAVAAEIDPNVPAQELVSALNSVTSTTQEGNEEEGKGKEGTGLLKLKKDKERKRSRSRDKKRSSRDRDRSSSKSSRSRSRRSKDRKRSRSRDRNKDRSKSRHREKKAEKKEKDAGEKEEEKSERNEVLTTEEEKLKKIEEDEEDRMPSSTVIIKTPEIEPEEPESLMLWKGAIVMADVAKFNGVAKEVSGDCFGLCYDIPGKVDVVGRIPFDTVWDYIARMKKMGTKDILVIKVVPQTEDERPSYVTLYNYLSKRARIGVVGKTSDAVKDFYLYPLASQSPLPQVLSPSDGSSFEAERENVILGVIVRNKHRNSQLEKVQRSVRKASSVDVDVSEVPVDRSYTPPLPDKDVVRQKRKIRVHVDFKNIRKSNEEDEEEEEEEEEEEVVQEEEERLTKPEDYESPYSPEDSDDDVPPLPKIAKPSPSVFGVSPSISKLLSPGVSGAADSLQDPVEIQKKIEEINRAIEEQTQQIQSLTSAVPKLGFGAIPGLPSAAPPPVDKVHLPLISESDECNNQRSFTPPLVIEKNISFLPEVTRKISLPSNLQEILNSIQKKSGNEEESPKEMSKTVEEVVKMENSDVKITPAVLEQTASILPGLEEKPATESTLSRLTDQELLQKVQEMEMDMAPCPPQPRPPGVDDIPLLPFANPPPPPLFSQPSMETKKSEKKKLDLKSVFENEGVPNFNIPGPGWDDKRGPKQKPFKIDIKLAMNTLEKKTIDVDHFDIESISAFPSGSATNEELHDERLYPKPDERFRNPQERNRRRSDERDWKYDRRLWDDGRRYKEDYRRHGRRDRPKFHKSSRHLQKDWEGSGKSFEERQRWRNQEMRREEIRRARKRADSAS